MSPEAPVPVFKSETQETRPGMAANVKKNLENLNCEVTYIHRQTSVKTRLIDKRSRQHIVRIDEDQHSDPISFDRSMIFYDAIVISDYNKGTVNYQLIEDLIKNYQGPIFIDTKKTDLKKANGAYVKINLFEESLIKTSNDNLIVTMGSKGAKYNGKIYKAKSIDVLDVTGAGDTFLSALTYSFLISKNIEESIKFAVAASGISVQHFGVYAPTLEEINQELA
jgi:D-beta-D-heptose 7-phosphate kinase/D-beta-D-heptose 1-phosphate adenosyltransferase